MTLSKARIMSGVDKRALSQAILKLIILIKNVVTTSASCFHYTHAAGDYDGQLLMRKLADIVRNINGLIKCACCINS